MSWKYEQHTEHVFEVLDVPTSCSRCTRPTLAVFNDKGTCSSCAGVFTAAERAAMLAAIRRPFPTDYKPRFGPPAKIDKAGEVKMLIDAFSHGDKKLKNPDPIPAKVTVLDVEER